MRTQLLIVFIICFFTPPAIAQHIIPFQSASGKWGYKDERGKQKIAPVYEAVDFFLKGVAEVSYREKWGAIHSSGKKVIDFVYAEAFRLAEDRIAFRDTLGKWGCLDLSGKLIISFEYEALQPLFTYREMLLAQKEGKWGAVHTKTGEALIPFLYDYPPEVYPKEGIVIVGQGEKRGITGLNGEEIVPLLYDEINSFSEEGLALVRLSSRCGFINRKGQEVIPLKYENARSFSEGFAPVKRDGYWAYINPSGKEITPFVYEAIDELSGQNPFIGFFPRRERSGFDEGFAAVKREGKWGLIDTTGREVVAPLYQRILNFQEDKAAVCREGKWGFIDKTGSLFTPVKYEKLEQFQDGIAWVSLNGKWGFINSSGIEIVPVTAEDIESSEKAVALKLEGKWLLLDHNGQRITSDLYDSLRVAFVGVARVKVDGKWGLLNYDDKKITWINYEELQNFHEGLAGVARNGKWGFIDSTGKEVIPLRYEAVWEFCNGLSAVKRNGKWGYINSKGIEIIPPVFSIASYFFPPDRAEVGYSDAFMFSIDRNGKKTEPAWSF